MLEISRICSCPSLSPLVPPCGWPYSGCCFCHP
uniref:Uncharacterized protein n=1 Tax=Anguilla anguilla TaxID=7936 RepID=A0A0E9VR44_ANGAN